MVDQATRDRLDDAVADAMAAVVDAMVAVVNRVAMRDEARDARSRRHHEAALIDRCRELKAAYDKRADALGYDRSKAR